MCRKKPRVNNREWDSPKIKEILRNEKYAGDLILQKKYIKDHLEMKTLKKELRTSAERIKQFSRIRLTLNCIKIKSIKD